MAGDPKERRLRFVRYSLTAFVGVTYAVSLGVLFVALAPLGALDVIVSWTIIFTILSVVAAMAIYYGYKAYLERGAS
ncbi:MAG: hypothetical protein HYZ68_03935 [Chloroflexi bacterium]|nr:hypothetical protein [Chloroflexota bacterium]